MSAPEDPFSPTADPAAYVPRVTTERALAALEEGYRAGQRLQVLSGPPGHGKTLMARVLALRLGEAFHPLYLPYASLPPDDFASWVLGLLEEDTRPGWRGLRELTHQSSLRPLLLLIDEASSMPEATAAQLDELLVEAAGGLRLLLIPAEVPPPGRVLRRMVSGAMELRLNAPLSAEETAQYVEARLARVAAPNSVRRMFDREMIERLQRAAEGIPSQVHRLATEVLRRNLAAVPALGPAPAPEGPLLADDPFAAESGAPRATTPAETGASEAVAEGAAPAAAAESKARVPTAGESPFSQQQPDPPSLFWIASVNLAIAGAVFGLLWWLGYIPPPH